MIQFKTAAEATEYGQLAVKNPGLWQLVQDLDEFCGATFNKDVVLTEVLRDRAEMRALYGRSNPDKAEHGTSPHMFWNAVDLRERIYTEAERNQMIEWLKQYDAVNTLRTIRAARSKTVWYHTIAGNVPHFHVQYRGPTTFSFLPEVITASR